MAAIAPCLVRLAPDGPAPWESIAREGQAWARREQVDLRDAVVLLPFSQLLPLARRAFAQHGGWTPRVETTQSLARSLGPPPVPEVGAPSGERSVDLLAAGELLRPMSFGARGSPRDPRAVDQAVADVVELTHALLKAAAQVEPTQRAAHWARARTLLLPAAGPGGAERALARVALEWAMLAPAPLTDRLFALCPSAWIGVRAGGADPLLDALFTHAAGSSACLVLDTDPPADGVPAMSTAAPVLAVCDGFEHEAQCAAAQVLRHVQRGETPVALIAQDRLLVRRVRALLDRRQVTLLDETGWKLSTTRAAAQVMSLLRAATEPRADAVLDWLKTGTSWSAVPDVDAALRSLEAALRRHQLTHVPALIGPDRLDAPATKLWAQARRVLNGAQLAGRVSLQLRLDALAQALAACGSAAALQADDAGRQVLVALRIDPAAAADAVWAAQAQAVAMDAQEFVAWVTRELEAASFKPAAPDAATVQVVITPLAQAMLRPFAAVVLPGADERQLGGAVAPWPLLSDTEAAALGLPDAAQRRTAEAAAFAQTLRAPRLTLLRRRLDGRDPLGASPLLERLSAAGVLLQPWVEARTLRSVPAAPIGPTAPAAPGLLPASLSASACEALRDCPYRFFALHMLRLREDDELDGEIEKRDYGDWLHAVLWAFHRDRGAPADAPVEVARLLQLAASTQADQGLDDADFIPFAASFAQLAPRYIEWLHRRDAEGARWQQGEQRLAIRPEALPGIELAGRVDRIDVVPREGGAVAQLIDYKTGQIDGLRKKLRDPNEDTQLAFYAALMAGRSDAALEAMYLALDGSAGIVELPHPQVRRSADQLLAGLAIDFDRLRHGGGLAPLGEGSTCTHCAARGLCRRDHWSAESPA